MVEFLNDQKRDPTWLVGLERVLCRNGEHRLKEAPKYLKRRRRDQPLKTLCQCSSWAGFNYQPISVSIHKVWTNHKAEILALALSKSDRGASILNLEW